LTHVDVVVVAYRSAAELRSCVEPLAREPGISVVVVDNACPEGSVDTVRDLPVRVVEMGRNAGFAAGCNAGARTGSGQAILFLNPDARIEARGVRGLAAVLERCPGVGAVGPHVLDLAGETQFSMRREPSLRRAFGEAFFIHHILRESESVTEFVRRGYTEAGEAEWLSGSALCVRRSAFEVLGGFDERFFMYSEDADLCKRIRNLGYSVCYEPRVTARHDGAASAPAAGQAALKRYAGIQYVRRHERGLRYVAFRTAFVVNDLLRIPLALTRSRAHTLGRLTSAATALGRRPPSAARRQT
jgi:N-acetylglucosaminyl-diphospho-decaprenol L-rhamnosyltransferase